MLNKYLLFLLLSGFNLILSAQVGDTIRLQVHYIASFKSYEEHTNTRTDEKILRIADHHSSFVGRWQEKRQSVVDSAMKAHLSVDETMSLLGKYPTPRQFYAIYDNFPSKGIRTVTDKLYKTFYYEEEIDPISWNILPRDTIILDIPCRFATTNYKGHRWTACFAPSIPVPAGPWKLQGLPGLILYAQDDTGIFSFECIEIRKGEGLLYAPSLSKAIKTTRKGLRNLNIESATNIDQFLQKRFGIQTKGYDANGKPIIRKKMTPIFMEDEE